MNSFTIGCNINWYSIYVEINNALIFQNIQCTLKEEVNM